MISDLNAYVSNIVHFSDALVANLVHMASIELIRDARLHIIIDTDMKDRSNNAVTAANRQVAATVLPAVTFQKRLNFPAVRQGLFFSW